MIRCMLIGDQYEGTTKYQEVAPNSVQLPVAEPVPWVGYYEGAEPMPPPKTRHVIYNRVYLSPEGQDERIAVYVAEGA